MLSNTVLSAADTLSVGVAIEVVGGVVLLLLLSLGVVNVSVEVVFVVVVEGVVVMVLVSLTVLVVGKVVGVTVGVGGWHLFAGLYSVYCLTDIIMMDISLVYKTMYTQFIT